MAASHQAGQALADLQFLADDHGTDLGRAVAELFEHLD